MAFAPESSAIHRPGGRSAGDLGDVTARVAALFSGLFVSAMMYPILILFGKLTAAGIGRLRPLGFGARAAITFAPAFLVVALMARDGYGSRNPLAKFERRVASPAPPGC